MQELTFSTIAKNTSFSCIFLSIGRNDNFLTLILQKDEDLPKFNQKLSDSKHCNPGEFSTQLATDQWEREVKEGVSAALHTGHLK